MKSASQLLLTQSVSSVQVAPFAPTAEQLPKVQYVEPPLHEFVLNNAAHMPVHDVAWLAPMHLYVLSFGMFADLSTEPVGSHDPVEEKPT